MRTVPPSQTKVHDRIKDPHHAAAVRRGKSAVETLRKRGILDEKGRRIRTDQPADMQEGKDRDCGG